MRPGCCARAASGQAAAPPSPASNSRRPMVTVIRPSRARCVKETIPRHGRAVFTFKEGRMLVAVIQLRGRMPSFPLCPRKRTYLPILERIPPPALGERCHRLETLPPQVAAEERCCRAGGASPTIDPLFRESYPENLRRKPTSTHGRKQMKTKTKTGLASILAIVLATAAASAQQAPSPPPTTPYGPPIGLEAAKKVMAAAEAEAVKNSWGMAIAILDSTGHMVMLHKLDNTQYGSIAVAEDKARSALYYRRPSKVFEDLVAQGGLGMRTLALRGASPLEGGIPLIADGKIIGAIGASGATSVQDGQVAKAGADVAK